MPTKVRRKPEDSQTVQSAGVAKEIQIHIACEGKSSAEVLGELHRGITQAAEAELPLRGRANPRRVRLDGYHPEEKLLSQMRQGSCQKASDQGGRAPTSCSACHFPHAGDAAR